MSVKKTAQKATKEEKAKNRQTIAEKIDLALGEFKNEKDKEKYQKGLKKASRLLSKVVVIPAAKKINRGKSSVKATAQSK